MKGKVYIVGAGPGDPELLTVRALHLLQSADVVLYDDLVSLEILNLISPTAELHNVGKRCGTKKIRQDEINFLMVAVAESGRQIIRLKSGDPMIFGRAGEEIEALRKAQIPFEIIPGVTSALGAAASARIPLTYRGLSSAVVYLTGHQALGREAAEWSKLVCSGSTLVIYMPGQNYAALSHRLRNAGLQGETPCAVISRASISRQQVHCATIDDLSNAPHLDSPTLLVVGEVVRFAESRVFDQFVTNVPQLSSEAGSERVEEVIA